MKYLCQSVIIRAVIRKEENSRQKVHSLTILSSLHSEMCDWNRPSYSYWRSEYPTESVYSKSTKIIQEQDREFEEAIQENIETNNRIAAAKRAAEEEETQRQTNARSRIEELRDLIRERASEIPPEPMNGIMIAICFPDMKRLTRKFGLDESCENIFAFVANDEQMFDDNSGPLKFSLMVGIVSLNKEQTLAQQGLTTRTLVRVLMDDESET
jgi:hypothetical protein